MTEGHVVIGKNVPFHWGSNKLIGWEIIDDFTLGKISGYNSRKEACIMFDLDVKSARYEGNKFKVFPLFIAEHAIMNPYFVGWDYGFIPSEEDKKLPAGMVWKVLGWRRGQK